MRQLFLYTALICGFAQAQAAAPSAAATLPAAHPLIGSWSWTLPGKQCAETWKFRANGTRTSRSGEEITQSRYELSPVPSLLGYYRLVETVSESNGKRDCSGDLHEVSDEAVTHYIQLSPKRDQLIVCKEESLKACFGPLKRKPE
ncbi:hypothetical protein SAMN05216344_10629 [Polaromonas sp. OV174]|uniref:hypothetical protein n=1 Tax=Polaromonas sp. OV174 TaxID=1855300 RepID=UPI0008F3FED7|nr:hypothetical protein [Polaromonas sp. OV174]SFB94525.1 hypothetical protein SAMN05216344_10629 [Polaromonas sp. OV174]